MAQEKNKTKYILKKGKHFNEVHSSVITAKFCSFVSAP